MQPHSGPEKGLARKLPTASKTPFRQAVNPGWAADIFGPEQRRILVVDDQDLVRAYCRLALEHLGFACDEATDGTTALEVFNQRSLRHGPA